MTIKKPDERARAGAEAPDPPWREVRAFFGRHGFILGLVAVLLGLVLRIHGLADYWVNPDEGIYYSTFTTDFASFWREMNANAHPPLYYLTLWLLSGLSNDFVVLRGVSLLSGCLAIWVIFLLGRESGGLLTGTIAGLFMALSRSAIEMSQILRPYMLQVALLTFSLYCLVRYLRDGRRRHAVAYVLVMVPALLTHYSSVLMVGGVGLALVALFLGGRIDRGSMKVLLRAHLPVGAAMAVMALHLWSLLDSHIPVEAQTGWLRQYMIDDPGSIWSSFVGVHAYLYGPAWGNLMSILFLCGLALAAWQRQLGLVAVTVGTLFLAVTGALLQQYPFGCTRHVFYLLPLLSVCAALPIGTGLAARPLQGALFGWALMGPLLGDWPVDQPPGGGGSQHEPLPEQIITRADVDEIMRALAAARERRSPVLMSLQTYYTLVPMLDRERSGLKWEPGDLFRIPWGETFIFVNLAWTMTTSGSPSDPRASFRGFLERIDAVAVPELRIREETAALLVIAGWETPLSGELATRDKDRLLQDRVIVAQTSRLRKRTLALVVDVRRFLAADQRS